MEPKSATDRDKESKFRGKTNMILSIDGGESIGAAALVKARCDVVEGLEASESVAVLPGIEIH